MQKNREVFESLAAGKTNGAVARGGLASEDDSRLYGY